MRTSSAILLACCVCRACPRRPRASNSPIPRPAQRAEAAAQAQRQAAVAAQLATPCRDKIRNRKIMVLIAEETNGMVMASQGGYSRHVEAVNLRLQAAWA